MAKSKGSSKRFPPEYFTLDDVTDVSVLQKKVKALKDDFEKVFPGPCASTDSSKEARIPIPLEPITKKRFRGYKVGGVKKYNELHKAMMSILSGLGELGILTTTMGVMPAPEASLAPKGKASVKRAKKRACK